MQLFNAFDSNYRLFSNFNVLFLSNLTILMSLIVITVRLNNYLCQYELYTGDNVSAEKKIKPD